ncbi:MAG: hypothetical protein HY815_03345 [Candidatus Riflebacteria bacterium]|nr:hypothetical protein [Candidatus Riflebacteria bacterium]
MPIVSSASPSTRQSALPASRSALPVANGPPRTVCLPSARHRSSTSSMDRCWMPMPVTNTVSAQRIWASESVATFRSTSVYCHSRGQRAATVIRLSGGCMARLPKMARAYWKPQ